MRLLFIRHCEPDYEHDTITKKGWREARLLTERLKTINIDHFYVSPLGRAKDTASLLLNDLNETAVECDWLREFPPMIWRPDDDTKKHIAWDWLPEDWTGTNEFFDRHKWSEPDVMKGGNVGEEYLRVIGSFDDLLEKHGYKREGEIYNAIRPSRETIAFFCHFGIECVLLSRLMNVSPMILWHHTCALPSSVTSLYTEERREGKAVFRMNYFGDLSHLYAGKEPASFFARYCETWDDMTERH